MKTLLLSLTLLLTQILSAQVFTQVDEIASFPACENIIDKTQKCYCNQSQLLLIGDSNSQVEQVELIIDGTGMINKWQTISSNDIEVKEQIDFIISELKKDVRLTPARISGRPVNYQMIMMVPVNVN